MPIESPFTDCTDLIGNRDRLLEQACQNGYLFFPKLLPAEPVLALRRQVLQVAEQHALLAPDIDPNAAIRRSGVFICEQDGSETFRRSTLMSRKSDSSTPFRITNVLCVFWRYYSAILFSSIHVISVTLSSPENISIRLLRIRTSIRFAVRRIRGQCGHLWGTVMPSWAVWRLHPDRTAAGS